MHLQIQIAKLYILKCGFSQMESVFWFDRFFILLYAICCNFEELCRETLSCDFTIIDCNSILLHFSYCMWCFLVLWIFLEAIVFILYISVMAVVENHRESGGIQYIFRPKWTSWEDFLISCKTTWVRAIKNRAYFY